MSWHQPVVHLGRTYMDAEHVREFAALLGIAAVRPARSMSPVQQRRQPLAQFPLGASVNGRTDRFVRGLHIGACELFVLEDSGDLLGQPAPSQ